MEAHTVVNPKERERKKKIIRKCTLKCINLVISKALQMQKYTKEYYSFYSKTVTVNYHLTKKLFSQIKYNCTTSAAQQLLDMTLTTMMLTCLQWTWKLNWLPYLTPCIVSLSCVFFFILTYQGQWWSIFRTQLQENLIESVFVKQYIKVLILWFSSFNTRLELNGVMKRHILHIASLKFSYDEERLYN